MDDKIVYRGSCDVNEVFENYQKLYNVSKRIDFEILVPEGVPAVLDTRMSWYGFYYDNTGNLQTLEIHSSRNDSDFESNDERANEIYDWYIGIL